MCDTKLFAKCPFLVTGDMLTVLAQRKELLMPEGAKATMSGTS